MPHILRFCEHIRNCGSPPGIAFIRIVPALASPLVSLSQVVGGPFYLFRCQNAGDLVRAVSLNRKLENPAHNRRRFLVNQPVSRVVRVLAVAVNDVVRGVLAAHALGPEYGGHFPAAIPNVPLVYDIQKGGELPAALYAAVNTVRDGNKPNTFFPEHNFGIEASLKIITPNPAHILGDHTADLSSFNIRNQAFPVRAVKAASRPAIICVMGAIIEPMLGSICFEHLFLMNDRVTIACRHFIVTR